MTLHLNNGSMRWAWLRLLILTVMATLVFEHSQLDVEISALFYTKGQWRLVKGAQPYAFFFYDGPKALLILLAIYLIAVLVLKYGQSLQAYSVFNKAFNRTRLNRLLPPLTAREISYLLAVLMIVPSSIALLKGVTHVSCPNHLTRFGGDLPYLSLWQDIVANTHAKCFPAAHASAGFSLYGFAFLPSLKQYRGRVWIAVTLLGWAMGLYKMLFGDHFFSHTLVSMLLSLTIACALSSLFFKAPPTIAHTP